MTKSVLFFLLCLFVHVFYETFTSLFKRTTKQITYSYIILKTLAYIDDCINKKKKY